MTKISRPRKILDYLDWYDAASAFLYTILVVIVTLICNFSKVSNANTLNKEPKAKVKCAAFVGYAELPTPKEYKPLSDEDKAYAQACIAKHGDNYVKMTRDIVTNYNQLTEIKLEKLCKKYEAELEMQMDS